MGKKRKASPSAARGLLDLPESCLQHIVSFMDWQTKLQFFRTSKGSQDEPGCAVLVLRASEMHCFYTVRRQNIKPGPAFCSLLHWASQISTDMQLIVTPHDHDDDDDAEFQLLDVLHSLLLYPGARATRSGRALGRPATYPGITSLDLGDYVCSSLIPGLVVDAFPNLKNLFAYWRPDNTKSLRPVLTRGLSSLQRVDVTWDYYTPDEFESAVKQHIVQQLSHMPPLTSIAVDSEVFQAVPAAVVAKLKTLQLEVYTDPTAKDKAALKACSQLESLKIWAGQANDWVLALPHCVPTIRSLRVAADVDDECMPPLLALPHLTSLSLDCFYIYSDDHANAPCSWKQLEITTCSSNITNLPLHALDSPVKCESFVLHLSDYAADLAAIRAAKPHLLRCGGIEMEYPDLDIDFSVGSTFTKKQAAEVLQEWAPVLPEPKIVRCHPSKQRLIKQTVTRLWPGAPLGYDDDL